MTPTKLTPKGALLIVPIQPVITEASFRQLKLPSTLSIQLD